MSSEYTLTKISVLLNKTPMEENRFEVKSISDTVSIIKLLLEFYSEKFLELIPKYIIFGSKGINV